MSPPRSPLLERPSWGQGGARKTTTERYNGVRQHYDDPVFIDIPARRPRSQPYRNTTQRSYYAEATADEDPRPRSGRPNFLQDDYDRSYDTEFIRGYQSYQRRPRSSSYDIGLLNMLSLHDRFNRGRVRSVSQERVQLRSRKSFLGPADVIWNPSLPRDTTVSLELDIEDDIESQLEEFSHLVRLGHFKEAEQHFERHLAGHISQEPVLLEYLDMLLERGDYLNDGSSKAPSNGKSPVPAENYGAESEGYHLNNSNLGPGRSSNMAKKLETTTGPLPDLVTRIEIGVYLRSVCRGFHSKGQMKQGLKVSEWTGLLAFMHARKTDRQPCSSDLQILQYYLKVLNRLGDRTNFTPPDTFFDIWSDRPHLYKSLVSDGRIWDVRDIIAASVPALGGQLTWSTFVGADLDSPTFFGAFLRDWNLEEYDASSYLATLDILVTLYEDVLWDLRQSLDQQSIERAKSLAERARRFSTCIRDNNPEYIKSRPYLRWILAEAGLEIHLARFRYDAESIRKRLEGFPGLTCWSTTALPIYIPIRSENPGWQASTLPGNSTALLKTGLDASRDLGDYRMEANFLRELAYRSENPRELLTELGNLQKLTQGDIVGYLETCLTKFLLAHDEAQLQALRDEITGFEEQFSSLPNATKTLEDSLIEWCKRKVQRALFGFREEFDEQRGEAHYAAEAVATDLPPDLLSIISGMARDISVSLHQGDPEEASKLERDRKELEEYRLKSQRDKVSNVVTMYNEHRKPEVGIEDKEKAYRLRLSDDLNKSGISKKKVAALLEWVQSPDLQNSTKMSRKQVSLRALKRYNYDYELDNAAPNSVIIKQPLRYYEKDFIIEQSKIMRRNRRPYGARRKNNGQENGRSAVEDRMTELYSTSYSSASDSDSINSLTSDLERDRRLIELPRDRMSYSDQKTVGSPFIVTASPIHPTILEPGNKGLRVEQPVLREGDYELQKKLDNELPFVRRPSDRLTVETIDDGPPVEEVDHGPPVEEIDDGPPVEEIDHGPPVEEIDHGLTVEIVDQRTDDKNHAQDGSENTQKTVSNGDTKVKASEEDLTMEAPKRNAALDIIVTDFTLIGPTFAHVDSDDEES
ncbi:hypothetical protein V490_05944 [Pseudogymnoascus sp. VKM F-3557]|nr:hypothetical protein V490_05944 [Pseudogymnoascus sp. VKM F-3557]